MAHETYIKPIRVDQLPLCYKFGRAFHEERDVPGTFSEETFCKNWTLFLQSPITTMLGLWKDGQLVGGIGGIVMADLTTGDMAASELFWYVDPEHRGGSWSVRLIKEFRAWGKSIGATRFRMVHMLMKTEHPSEVKLHALYEHLGLRAVEVAFDGPI
jgi:GNAT superfamily N-acetyltransferase